MSTIKETPVMSAECPHCKVPVMGTEWSESIDERQTLHLWHCPICGYEFETMEDHVEKLLPDNELMEEFLPNLMVA